MDLNQFTENSIKAIQQAISTAQTNGNPQIEQSHILHALLTLSDSLIANLLLKMGVDVNGLINELVDINNKYAKVSGGQEPYLSQDTNLVLNSSMKIAKGMGDEYV